MPDSQYEDLLRHVLDTGARKGDRTGTGTRSIFGHQLRYRLSEGFPLITPVVKLEHERVNFGGLWHSDTAYLQHPPMGTMLVAREVRPLAVTPSSPTCISPTRPCRPA